MRKIFPVVSLYLLLSAVSFAQTDQKAEPQSPYLIEVTQTASVPHSFQKLEQASVYGGFTFLPGWPRSGEIMIEGVQIRPRVENGEIKVKVTVLRGTYWDKPEVVADYTLSEKPVLLDALKTVGIVPFELRLVRAPTTVAALPTVINSTRSLVVTVEAVAAALPSFRVKVTNSSSKPVLGIAYVTMADGRRRNIAAPRGRNGNSLIDVSQTFEFTMPYPLKAVRGAVSEGPVPETGAELKIQSAVFSDGSYEGEAGPAARILGAKLGEKVQLNRILSLLRSDAAADKETLSAKVEALSQSITEEDFGSILRTFPDLNAGERDFARSAAEVSANEVQVNFKKNFGKAGLIPVNKFNDAVKAAILTCEKVIASLP